MISYIKSFIQGVYKLALWMDCLKSINHWSTAFRNCNLHFQLLTQVPMTGLGFLLLYIKCFTMNEYTLKSETIFDNWKPFKNDEKCCLYNIKSSFHSQNIKFLSSLFGHAEKRFDSKGKGNFKIYDVTTWLTNIYNIPISQWNLVS